MESCAAVHGVDLHSARHIALKGKPLQEGLLQLLQLL